MAIKNNYTKKQDGFSDAVALDAYSKIERYDGGKDKTNIYVNVFSDSSKTKIIDSKAYSFQPDLDSELNFISQGYEHLKSLDEYTGAVDV